MARHVLRLSTARKEHHADDLPSPRIRERCEPSFQPNVHAAADWYVPLE
jgi:hypothetical protein